MEVTVGFGSDFWFDCVALLVGCTIDCHSEISSSLVRGHVPGSNLHGTVPPLVIASNLCKVDPHDACFNSSRFPFFFSLYDLWVPPFHCCFYLLFWSFLCHFLVPFQVTKPPVKLKCHQQLQGDELLVVVLYYTLCIVLGFFAFVPSLCVCRLVVAFFCF